MTDLFDVPALARLYDLECGAYDADLPFYRRFLRRGHGPVLDMGAGSGRVALALARAGFTVTAVERSPAMLALARERLAAAPPAVRARVALVRSDVRRARLPRGHQAAVAAFNTLLHVADAGGQLRTLLAARSALVRGGLLLMEVGSPYAEILNPNERRMRHVYTRDADGGTVTLREARRVDLLAQTTVTELFYDLTDARGALTRRSATLTQRWLFRHEIELLLERAGFRLRAVYGDYACAGPPADPFAMMLIVAAKR